jgi:uncharacterized protein (UPF0335 family)
LAASERSAGSFAFGGCIASHSRQDAVLERLHQMTTRIERLSQAEHDLISDVHPQVSEIKEQVESVREVVSSEKS